MPRHKHICSHCGATFYTSTPASGHRGERLEEGYVHYNGKVFCQHCFEEHFEICGECGKYVYEDEPQWENANGDWVCKKCFDEKYVECSNCGTAVPKNEAKKYGDEYYCPDCFDENFTTCNRCGCIVPKDETYETNDGLVCESCYDDYVTCEDCDAVIHRDEAHFLDGYDRWVCDDCFSDHYCECDGCGEFFHEDDLEDGYCSCCREDEDRENCPPGVHEYHWGKRNWISGPYYNKEEHHQGITYGVELEMDYGRFNFDEMGDGDQMYHFEHDGSLGSEGVELITQPCSLKYHQKQFGWDEILRKARSHGFRSHDTSCCGLHVHIGRKFLTQSDILKLDLFVNKYIDQWVHLARRRSGWARGYKNKNVKDCCRSYCDHCNDHNIAVNHGNAHTIEIRIAKGSLKYETVLGTIECYDAMIHFLRGVGVYKLFNDNNGELWDRFVKFVSDRPKDYPCAIEMMDRLGHYQIAREARERIFQKEMKKRNWQAKQEEEQ